jgi:uncharacterized protein involved in exopolysaccharide biosynthesis
MNEDGIDLFALFRILWRYRYAIILATVTGGVTSIALALLATPYYQAEVVVTEVRSEDMTSTASILSQFSGIASLAGLTLPSGGGTQDAQPTLRSRRLVQDFVERHELLDELSPEGRQVTLWNAVSRFKESVLSIREDARRGTMTVVVEWTDPETAARWANDFVALANQKLRERALSEAQRNVAYLNEQIALTNVVELQRVMYALIESETKKLMLANARAEYAFAVVDPAVAPEIRSRPRRTLMAMVGTALGLFVGLAVAFSLDLVARRRAVVIEGS